MTKLLKNLKHIVYNKRIDGKSYSLAGGRDKMTRPTTKLPSKRKFNGKWYELDWIDDGRSPVKLKDYIRAKAASGVNYRIVSKTYPGLGTYKAVYIRDTRKRIPDAIAGLRRR